MFCGPAAVVFVKRTAAFQGEFRLAPGELKNAGNAFRVFDFALAMGDFRGAWDVLNHVESDLQYQANASDLEAARAYREGHRALRAGDWDRAKTLFDIAMKDRYEDDRVRLIRIFLGNIAALRAQGKAEQTLTFEAALTKLAAPE